MYFSKVSCVKETHFKQMLEGFFLVNQYKVCTQLSFNRTPGILKNWNWKPKMLLLIISGAFRIHSWQAISIRRKRDFLDGIRILLTQWSEAIVIQASFIERAAGEHCSPECKKSFPSYFFEIVSGTFSFYHFHFPLGFCIFSVI